MSETFDELVFKTLALRYDERDNLRARIAELEESIDVLRKDNDMLFRAVIAASDQSRRNTQTQTLVYGKECKQ